MALDFDASASNRSVSHGSAAALDNLPNAGPFTVWALVYRTTNAGNQFMVTKANGSTTGWALMVTNSPSDGCIRFLVWRASLTDFISSTVAVPLNTWTYVAATFNDAASPKIHLYYGTKTTAMAEVAYNQQTAGSGAFTDDSALNLIVGNRTGLDLPFRGRIQRASVISRALTLAQLEDMRNAFIADANVANTLVLGDYHSTSSQTDQSGNGNTGTVTSATLAGSGLGVKLAVTDSNLFFSPYNWYSDGGGALAANNVKGSSTYVESNNPGAYCKFSVTVASDADAGGIVAVHLDTNILASLTASKVPQVAVSVDGGPFVATQAVYSSSTTRHRIEIGAGLSVGTHTVELFFQGIDLNSPGNRWATGDIQALKITALEIDSTAVSAVQTLRTNNILIFGDSMTEGANTAGTGLTVSTDDATLAWGPLLARALNAEYGVVAYGGEGIDKGIGNLSASNNSPSLYNATGANQSWDKYFASNSRLVSGALKPDPYGVFIMSGFNDLGGLSQSSVTALANAIAAAIPSTAFLFFLGYPVSTNNPDAVVAAGVAAATARTRTKALGSVFTKLITAGTASRFSNDAGSGSVHPNYRGQSAFAAEAIEQIQAQIDTWTATGTATSARGLTRGIG